MREHPILFSTPMVKAIFAGNKTQTRRVVTKRNSEIGEGGDWDKLDFNGEYKYSSKPKTKVSAWVDHGFPNSNGKYNYQYLHVPYNFKEWETIYRVYPRYQVGEHLWVRETHYRYGHWVKNGLSKTGKQKWTFKAINGDFVCYISNPPDDIKRNSYRLTGWYKRPAVFMPRKFSRITLEITNIRVQRIQDISELDAFAEGIDTEYDKNYLLAEHHSLAGVPVIPSVHAFSCLWNTINEKRGYGWDKNPWVWAITFKRLEAPHE